MITEEMYKEAYKYGKEVYLNKISKEDAAKLVNIKTGMNVTSALYYIESAVCMIKGVEFKHFTSEQAVDYYIYMIKEDFGIEGLKNTLKAIEEHIKWQERHSKALPKYLYVVVNDLKENVLSMWEEEPDRLQ